MRPSSRLAALALALALAGCEWFSTMSDPPAIQPYEREPLLPPPHAVALDGGPEFTIADADQAIARPAVVWSAAAGEAYYEAFCAVCHGSTGLGNGPLSTRFPAIPAVATARVGGYTDAYLYALITKGRGLMPEYSRIPVPARWAIVDHLRTLGTAGDGAATGGTAPAVGPGAGGATADTAGGGPP